MSEFEAIDEDVRRRLTEELEGVDIDMDGQWARLTTGLLAERRRSAMLRTAVAASVLALVVPIGRPLVGAGPAALGVVTELFGGAADKVMDVMEDGFEEGSGTGSHDRIDEDNEYWVSIRAVHEQLNDAVGWKQWEPEELDGANDRLLEIIGAEPEFEEQVRSAAQLIRGAADEDNRDPAVDAHRIIEDIERGLHRR
jgi:hypothetical protein